MRNRNLSAAPVFVVMLAVIVLMLGSSAVFAEDENALIDKVRLDFNAAFNAGDAEGIAKLIADDGVWLPPGHSAVVGPKDIAELYAKTFSTVKVAFELKPGAIQLCGEWAFMNGEFSRADTPKEGGDVKQIEGHYLFVLKKQTDGGWKIVRDIWNGPLK